MRNCLPGKVPLLTDPNPRQGKCMQAHYREHSKLTYARSVFVIHNMAHQGRGPMAELPPLEIPAHHTEAFRLYDPIGGEHMNIMKAGLQSAHRIVAVSHG